MNHNRDDAYALPSDPQVHREYYDAWASTYDEDFARATNYCYPRNVARILASRLTTQDGPVLDLGCGTGLLGEALRSVTLLPIDGADISPASLEVARTRDVYRTLFTADLSQPPQKPGSYGCLTSCGAFTVGHLDAQALSHSLQWARAGALVAIGINLQHYDDRDFSSVLATATGQGVITDVDVVDVPIYGGSQDTGEAVSIGRVAVFRIR